MRIQLCTLALVAGCATSPSPGRRCPACPESGAAAAPAPFDSAIASHRPVADAPAGLSQYGRLVGTWRCQNWRMQPDGNWQAGASSTWTFFYALGGAAIQDVWQPDNGGAIGTNVRLYDAESGSWTMVWASANQSFFDTFTATSEGDDIVMHGDRQARPAFGAHRARIRFHDISTDGFSWIYHATAPAADGPWQPIQKLRCQRRGE